MITLQNVLKFIELKDCSIRAFEKEAGLSNGTLNNCLRRKADLSAENTEKIVEKFSTELSDAGFAIIDLSNVGAGKAIINKEELANVEVEMGFLNSAVKESSVTYEKNPLIEINTAGGKLSINPENKDAVIFLNALLAEKEERQKAAEKRAERAEQEKDILFSLYKQNQDILQTVTNRIDINVQLTKTDLEALKTDIKTDNQAIMDSIDIAANQPVGTTRTNAEQSSPS